MGKPSGFYEERINHIEYIYPSVEKEKYKARKMKEVWKKGKRTYINVKKKYLVIFVEFKVERKSCVGNCKRN